MIKFENEDEKKYWLECIQHAQRLKEGQDVVLNADDYRYSYVRYADEMLEELRKRSK